VALFTRLYRDVQSTKHKIHFCAQLPDSTNDSAKPVMVWIHGGGFYQGSGNSDLYGPDHLMSEDVVLVTINYRLGALGRFQTIYYNGPCQLAGLYTTFRYIRRLGSKVYSRLHAVAILVTDSLL
jgi:acetyl esterase/lipase